MQKSKYIIEETFKSENLQDRKEIFENLLINLIKKLEDKTVA